MITTGDPVSVELTAQHALDLQPGLDIVARVRARTEGEDLQEMGVRQVVWPEMEAGLEVLRHTLYRYRTPDYEVDRVVYQLRERLSFNVSDRSRLFRGPVEYRNRLRPSSSGAPASEDTAEEDSKPAPANDRRNRI